MFVTMQLVRVNSDETSLYVQSDHGRLHISIVSQAMDKYAVKLYSSISHCFCTILLHMKSSVHQLWQMSENIQLHVLY